MKSFGFGFLTGILAYYGFGLYAMHRMNETHPSTMECFYEGISNEFFNGMADVEALRKF